MKFNMIIKKKITLPSTNHNTSSFVKCVKWSVEVLFWTLNTILLLQLLTLASPHQLTRSLDIQMTYCKDIHQVIL